ncbi:putative Phytocyanin domain, cupredoxin [Helianthus annuus]|nr:putative Phytocyanin domain, cupredoxin [Helianthus annuus]KAJ0673725.1 putative Phytocyanin domain, cupredoxin [Helianthus annuus]
MGLMRFSLLCFVTCFVLFSLNFDTYEAREFVVGGKENSWRIPTSADTLNVWAQHERFKIGDSLVFKYDSKNDSVLRVEEGDYKKCIKAKPIEEYHDGNTTININESGAFFFISGADGHCEKGEKVEIRVLSHKHSSPPPSQAPKSSPATPTPPVTPAESPKSGSVGLDLWIMDVFVVAVATTLVGISMV